MNNQHSYPTLLCNMLNQRGKTSLEEMKFFLSNLNCPDDTIDSIINRTIVDLIMEKLLPSGSLFDLLFRQIREVITDITQEYLKDILEYMANKGWVRIDKELNKIFKNKVPLPNC